MFLKEEGMKPAEIYCRMLAECGDLAPYDYHLFWPVKDTLRESNFSSDEVVTVALHEWHQLQP
jgi:hypothetical protein